MKLFPVAETVTGPKRNTTVVGLTLTNTTEAGGRLCAGGQGSLPGGAQTCAKEGSQPETQGRSGGCERGVAGGGPEAGWAQCA